MIQKKDFTKTHNFYLYCIVYITIQTLKIMNIELTTKQEQIAKSFEASAKLNNSTIASYNLLLLRMQALLEKSRKNL